MKKLLLTTAIVMSFGTTAAFAHHPAEEMVDPVTYLMIDTNLIDTPHYDMEFDDEMGGTTEVGGGAVARDDMEDGGAEVGGDRASFDAGEAMEQREEMNSMAETAVPSGTMNSKR